jgi:hypothetical protein
MNSQNESDLERNMRAAFEPDAESVDRVVTAALRSRPPRPMKPYIAAALALAAISIVAVRLWFPQTHVQAENIRLEYVGNVALIEFPDGSSWVVSPDKIHQGSHAQLNLIILEGDKP